MQIIEWAGLLLVTWGTAVVADWPIVDLGYQRHQAISFNVSLVPMRKTNGFKIHLSDDLLYDIPSQPVTITNFSISVMPSPH